MQQSCRAFSAKTQNEKNMASERSHANFGTCIWRVYENRTIVIYEPEIIALNYGILKNIYYTRVTAE